MMICVAGGKAKIFTTIGECYDDMCGDPKQSVKVSIASMIFWGWGSEYYEDGDER